MGLGTQLLVLCVAMLSVLQQMFGLLWETVPMVVDAIGTFFYFCKMTLLFIRNYVMTDRCFADVSDAMVGTSGEGRLARHEKEAEETAEAARTAARMAWAAVAIATVKAEKATDDYDHDSHIR
jgi:hypothetical protein